MKKNCLIIGFGSIGKRHARILKNMGNMVSVVSRRNDISSDYKVFNSVHDAFNKSDFDYIIISNKTSEHFETLNTLLDLKYKKSLLIEKPLFHFNTDINLKNNNVYAAYNLRFHPIIKELKKRTKNEKLISMHVYCGQYLPDWRPGSDYTETYSASIEEGGGVLRDLSHELDYICWLTGSWKYVSSISGKFSNLAIDSDDTQCILMETNNCPAITLQLNYIDKKARRNIILNSEKNTYNADLIKSTIQVNSDEVEHFNISSDTTYLMQHEAIIDNNNFSLCSFKEGTDILKLIEAIEIASRKRIWIKNK